MSFAAFLDGWQTNGFTHLQVAEPGTGQYVAHPVRQRSVSVPGHSTRERRWSGSGVLVTEWSLGPGQPVAGGLHSSHRTAVGEARRSAGGTDDLRGVGEGDLVLDEAHLDTDWILGNGRVSLFGAGSGPRAGEFSYIAAAQAGGGVGTLTGLLCAAVCVQLSRAGHCNAAAIGSLCGVVGSIGAAITIGRSVGRLAGLFKAATPLTGLRSDVAGIAAAAIAEGTGMEGAAATAICSSTRVARRVKAAVKRRTLFGSTVGPTRLKRAIDLADKLQARLSGVNRDTPANRLVVERAAVQELRDMELDDVEKAHIKPLTVSLYFMRRLPALAARALECDPASEWMRQAYDATEYVHAEPAWAGVARDNLPGWMAEWLISAKTERHPLRSHEDE